MRFDPGYLFGMVLQTVPEPRKVARDLFDLPVSRGTRWLVLWLMLVLATMLAVVNQIFLPLPSEVLGPVLSNVLYLSALQISYVLIGVFLIYLLGRLAGGAGKFEDAISVFIWVEFCALVFRGSAFLLSLFAPALSGILLTMNAVLSFWILSHFTAESHGFRSSGLVFASIATTIVLAIFALSFLLVLLGVEPIQIGV